ncbi:MAG: hypothetical protein R3F19_01520 [Verrucomicrobiales bacterium]
MMHGTSYWAERLTRVDDMQLTGHQGIAVGDVNGDGLEDIYACDGGALPNRLYVQEADGTLSDRSAAAGVDFLEDSRSALIVTWTMTAIRIWWSALWRSSSLRRMMARENFPSKEGIRDHRTVFDGGSRL